MSHLTSSAVFQLRVVLCGVSPLVWRRLLVPGDLSLVDFHRVLQIAFGWSDFYLYTFHFHGRTVGRHTRDPHSVQLSDLALHRGERFRYRYNFFAPWDCDVRLESILPQVGSPVLPCCVAGRNPAPDEDEGGAWHYQQLQDHHRFPPRDALLVLAKTIHNVLQQGNRAEVDLQELEPAQERVDAYLEFRERKFQR
jgi:hypothetical protein